MVHVRAEAQSRHGGKLPACSRLAHAVLVASRLLYSSEQPAEGHICQRGNVQAACARERRRAPGSVLSKTQEYKCLLKFLSVFDWLKG
jgi:hypothetical protein